MKEQLWSREPQLLLSASREIIGVWEKEQDMTKTVNIRLGSKTQMEISWGEEAWSWSVPLLEERKLSPGFSGSLVGGGVGWVLKDLFWNLCSSLLRILR